MKHCLLLAQVTTKKEEKKGQRRQKINHEVYSKEHLVIEKHCRRTTNMTADQLLNGPSLQTIQAILHKGRV